MSIVGKIKGIAAPTIKDIDERIKRLESMSRETSYIIEQAKKEIDNELDALNKRQKEIEREESKLKLKIKILNELKNHYEDTVPYIAKAYADYIYTIDSKVSEQLVKKSHPAISAALTVKQYAKENKSLRQQNKEYEYLLSELMFDESDTQTDYEDFECANDEEDTVTYFITKEEYQRLNEEERNQLALDRYMQKRHSRSWIGRMYERYIGYLYEMKGWTVIYRGIELGVKDQGIDLICRKEDRIHFVQCKCWSTNKTIYEKHLCQLFGACIYQEETNKGLQEMKTSPVFICTTKIDATAAAVANILGIKLHEIHFDKEYPMIKCNINKGERIYHLPFDQQYDRTIIKNRGECYVRTVKDAMKMGFRRAKRHIFD